MIVSQKFIEVLTHECSHIIFSHYLTLQNPLRIQISPEYYLDSIQSWTGLVQFEKYKLQTKSKEKRSILVSLAGIAAEHVFFDKPWSTLLNDSDNFGDLSLADKHFSNYRKTKKTYKKNIEYYFRMASTLTKKWEHNIIKLRNYMETKTDPNIDGFEYYFKTNEIAKIIHEERTSHNC